MTAHWILYIWLSVFGSGYVTTDRIEGFSNSQQCERQAARLYSVRSDVKVNHVCLEVR